MGTLFSKPKQDTCAVTVKAFYIVGTVEERLAKCSELMSANPQLSFRIINVNDNYSATALQLSDKSFSAHFWDIKLRAEAQQALGENAVFIISPASAEYRM